MKSFKFSFPAKIYFGRDCVKENASLIRNMGKKAFVITSKFIEGYENIGLKDVERLLWRIGNGSTTGL